MREREGHRAAAHRLRQHLPGVPLGLVDLHHELGCPRSGDGAPRYSVSVSTHKPHLVVNKVAQGRLLAADQLASGSIGGEQAPLRRLIQQLPLRHCTQDLVEVVVPRRGDTGSLRQLHRRACVSLWYLPCGMYTGACMQAPPFLPARSPCPSRPGHAGSPGFANPSARPSMRSASAPGWPGTPWLLRAGTSHAISQVRNSQQPALMMAAQKTPCIWLKTGCCYHLWRSNPQRTPS